MIPAPSLACTLNHYLCPHDMPVESFLDLAVAHGFSGVALTVRSLTECPAHRLAPLLRARVLSVSSVNSAGYFLFEGHEAAGQHARNDWLLAQTAELGDTALNVIVGGSTTMDLYEARRGAGARLVQMNPSILDDLLPAQILAVEKLVRRIRIRADHHESAILERGLERG